MAAITVNPTNNYIGQALNSVENSVFKYKAQKTAEEQAQAQALRQEQEDRRRDFKDSAEFSEKHPFVAMGNGLDGSNMQSYTNAMKTASDAQSNYMKTGDEKQKAIWQNAVNSVKGISQMPTQLNVLQKSMDENPEKFNPSSLKTMNNRIKNILSNGQIMQENDENGNATWTYFNKDENGNVSKVPNKQMNKNELLAFLTPVAAFDVNGKDGFIAEFNRGIGKERKVIEGTGMNAKEKTYNPGAEELAKMMADEAVNDKSKMYDALSRLGLDPDNDKNYSDPKIKEKASEFLQKMLMVTAPTTISNKPDDAQQRIAISQSSLNETISNNKRNYNRNISNDEVETNSVTITDSTDPLTGQPVRTETRKVTTKQPKVTTNIPKVQTQQSWNAEWAKLKKGQTLKGLDGNTYTKK
jgi:hypothetical protein